MTTLDKDKIKNLSRLCRLKMSEEEIEIFNQDISKIISYVELLNEVDLTDLVPHSHVESQGMDLRDDEIKKTLSREEFLNNAPKHIGGMVAVPLIIQS